MFCRSAPGYSSSPKRPAGAEVAEIKPIANPGVASDALNDIVPVGGEEEDRFPWEDRDDEGGTYFNPDTRETRTIQPGSGIVLREPSINLDNLPTRLISGRRRRKRGPTPALSTNITASTRTSSTLTAPKITRSKPTNFSAARVQSENRHRRNRENIRSKDEYVRVIYCRWKDDNFLQAGQRKLFRSATWHSEEA